MALFGFKKKKVDDTPKAPVSENTPATSEVKAKKAVKARPAKTPKPAKQAIAPVLRAHSDAHVLRSSRITEKATMHVENGAYLFNVAPNATKRDIAQAIFSVYKVSPRMVRVVTIPSKRKRNSRTGKAGVKSGGKKAYVYLKKGETIAIT